MDARLARTTAAAGLALLFLGARCSVESSNHHSNPPESPKIQITQPTTASSLNVAVDLVDLGGWAAIDAWSYSYEIEPHVRWWNVTTGMVGGCSEHVDWEWFLYTLYPANHTWSASVPLVPGANDVRVEAYYSTSGTVVGSDAILVRRN